MTPEEAIGAITANYPPENYTMLREALDMAITALGGLDEAEALIKKNAGMINDILAQLRQRGAEIDRDRNIIEFLENELKKDSGHRYADLQAICDEQDAQNRLLKEKLEEERAKYIHIRDREATFGRLDQEYPDVRNDYLEAARSQLQAEMPEVFDD